MNISSIKNNSLFLFSFFIIVVLLGLLNYKDRFISNSEQVYRIQNGNQSQTDFKKLEAKFSNDVFLLSVYKNLTNYSDKELEETLNTYFSRFSVNETERVYVWQSVYLQYLKSNTRKSLDSLFIKVFANASTNMNLLSDQRSYSGWNLLAILLAHKVGNLEDDFSIISQITPFGGGIYNLDDSNIDKLYKIAAYNYSTNQNFKTISTFAYVTLLRIPFLTDEAIKISEKQKAFSLLKEAMPFAKDNFDGFSYENTDSNPVRLLHFSIAYLILEKETLVMVEDSQITSEGIRDFLFKLRDEYKDFPFLNRNVMTHFALIKYALLYNDNSVLKSSLSEFEKYASMYSIPYIYYKIGNPKDTGLSNILQVKPDFLKSSKIF